MRHTLNISQEIVDSVSTETGLSKQDVYECIAMWLEAVAIEEEDLPRL